MRHCHRARSFCAILALITAACTPAAASPPQPAGSTPAAVAPATVPAAPTAEAALETVRVGVLNIASDAAFHLASERGYLREQGLEIETTRFDSAQRMTTPLGADQLDVGAGAPGPGLYNAILRGINLRLIADRGRAVPGVRFNCLVVRKELLDSGAIRTIADLRGHMFAENVPGTITSYVLEKQLRRAGVRPDELSYTTLPFPDTLNGFVNDAADAAFLVEPFITLGEKRGVSECWHPTSELEPNFQIAMILYGPAFAEERPDTARGFTVAYLRGVRDYYRAFFGDGQGRAEILDLIARTTSVKDVALLDQMAPTWIDPNGTLNVDSLRALERWYFERGDMPAEVDFDRVVDTSFVDYALGQLGRYPMP
jgi:NitT/TauT family transport system substrate-binding protein